MGKTKKKSKLSRARVNPFPSALGAVGGSESGSNLEVKANEKYNKATNLINQITSSLSSSNDKVIALTSISVMCSDAGLREEFMKQNLVGILFTQNPNNVSESQSNSLNKCFLNCESLDIINQSLEILKVLSFEDGYPISTHLWKKRKVWSYLELNLNNLKKSFNEFAVDMSKFSGAQKELLFELTENVFGVIIALINGSDNILEELLDENPGNEKISLITEFVTKLLTWILDVSQDKRLKVSYKLFNTILDLVYDFSSESKVFIEKLINEHMFNLQQLIDFGQVMTGMPNLTKIYMESIKFQIFEVLGQRLSQPLLLSEEFELQRDAVFVEIYHNLTGFLENTNVLSVLQKNSINPLDYITSEDKTLSSPEFVAKYQEKLGSNDDIQAIEISLDLVATIIEYAGTKPDLVKLLQPNMDRSSQPLEEHSTGGYNAILNYFNHNPLINGFINTGFFDFLTTCLTGFDYKFELRALDCFINMAILFSNLETHDLPTQWSEHVKKLWNVFTTKNDNISPIYKPIITNDSTVTETVIYNLHLQTKVFQFLNATVTIVYSPHYLNTINASAETVLQTTVNATIDNFVQTATIHYNLQNLPKKKANTAENKEFLEIVDQYYSEILQLFIVLAQLPLINLNATIGGFLIEGVLNSDFNTPLVKTENQSEQGENLMAFFISPEIIIDLISSVFDIYGDSEFVYDAPVFVSKNYANRLRQTKDLLKNHVFKAKIDKNKNPQLKELSFEVIKELERFIKYKESERK